jgi:N-acylneuraminate cytidylyltransferase
MPEVLISVPTTAPLRDPRDIEACIKEYFDYRPDAVITVTPANRNPHFNMVSINGDGECILANSSQKIVFRRQDAPVIYDMTTVAYVVKSDFIFEAKNLFDGRVRAVIIPKERAVDIDDYLDFKFAELLIEMRCQNEGN